MLVDSGDGIEARPKPLSAMAYSEALGACDCLAKVYGELEARLQPVLLKHGPPTPVPPEGKDAPDASPLATQFDELAARVVGLRVSLQRIIERLDC